MIHDKTDKRKNMHRRAFVFALAMSLAALLPVQAFAGPGYMQWLSPFEQLVDSMIGFMGIIGKGLLGWALFEVATALFSHDTSQMPQALRRIGAGTILIFIETIIAAMTSTHPAAPATQVPDQALEAARIVQAAVQFYF